jgi:Ca2+-binding EF-hand superfamily protein
VAGLELLVDDEDPEMPDDAPPPRMAPLDVNDDFSAQEQQQRAAKAMWAEPVQQDSPPPAVFDPADEPDSPEGVDAEDVAGGGGEERPPAYGADAAEEALRRKIYQNYEDLRAAFRALDRSNNGYVSREDFFQAMGNIFLSNGFSEDDIYEVADRFDLNKDGYISFQEFVAIVEGTDGEQPDDADDVVNEEALEDDPRLVTSVELAIQKFKTIVDQRYTSVRKAFMALNTERNSALSPSNFAKGLMAHGIFLSPPELELAWSAFDRSGNGQISYNDFASVMTQRLQFGSHLRRQMFQ